MTDNEQMERGRDSVRKKELFKVQIGRMGVKKGGNYK